MILVTLSGTGPNENPLTGPWTTIPTYAPMQRGANRILGTDISGNNGAYANSVMPSVPDVYAEMTYDDVLSAQYLGPMVRYDPAGRNGYGVQPTPTGVELYKWTAGVYGVLDTYGVPIVLGDTLRVHAVGTTIEATLNGTTTICSAVDGTFAAAGRFAMYAYGSSCTATRFEGGDFLSPVPPSPTPTNPIGRQGLAGGGRGMRPGIPAVDLKADPHIRKVLTAMKENIEISNGIRAGTGVNEEAWKRRTVSLNMLVKLGIITEEQARSVWQEP